jgi:hypothetical protein
MFGRVNDASGETLSLTLDISYDSLSCDRLIEQLPQTSPSRRDDCELRRRGLEQRLSRTLKQDERAQRVDLEVIAHVFQGYGENWGVAGHDT